MIVPDAVGAGRGCLAGAATRGGGGDGCAAGEACAVGPLLRPPQLGGRLFAQFGHALGAGPPRWVIRRNQPEIAPWPPAGEEQHQRADHHTDHAPARSARG